MRFSKFRFEAVALFATALLAACGGGGGGSDGSSSASSNSSSGSNATTATTTTTNTTTTTSTNSAILITPASQLTSMPTASGNASADGTAYINAMRKNVGLSALPSNAGLATASSDHATYLVDNQAYGHTETAGNPGFTGADPQTRIEAEGSFTMMGEVVVAGQPAAFSDSVSPVETLFDAPFHRIVMLDDFTSMGVGYMANANWEAFNIDFGSTTADTTLSSKSLVAYPFPGEQGVPTSWFANEDPNPFASATQYEMTTVGYPVTIQSAFGSTLSSMSFTITATNGTNIPCLAQTPQTTPNELSNAALCAPYSPLAASTTYTVHVTGTLTDSSSQTHPIDVLWTFTTAASGVSHNATQGLTSRPLPKF
ncbi:MULTISPECIES: CAP domain-containing protein [unclassified Paraburkholderia]|uniref:CAP domain-containing protein n=1 Tax=unclassified Paraburkholderia TaxID=2615204 RepID=UPI002AB242BB|nr:MULTISPECIES: CAP domain-containing protein [unclassified Paraburkholderia]